LPPPYGFGRHESDLLRFAAVFSLAHGSQFYVNVPIALGGGGQGESYWPVLSGPMLYLFVIVFARLYPYGRHRSAGGDAADCLTTNIKETS